MREDPRRHFHDVVTGARRGIVPALERLGLAALSLPYGAAIRLRNTAYDLGLLATARAAVSVVSVGNLTVGGTGKTPCVEYVARYYRQRELRVAILSRGYGADHGPNDEALLLEDNLPDVPHLQQRDRVALARTAVEELDSEVLILDDGFQHRRLARDLDLVLIDATCPWGLGRLLPRGLLREPLGSLRRAHAVLLTRGDQVSQGDRAQIIAKVRKLAPAAVVVETRHQPVDCVNGVGETAPLDVLTDTPVAAFCGIGNPAAFRRTLADRGADVCAFRVFPDHHRYTRADVDVLAAWARSLDLGTVLVTTQKDIVKLRVSELGGRPLWSVRVRLSVESGQERLHELLDQAVAHGPPGEQTEEATES